MSIVMVKHTHTHTQRIIVSQIHKNELREDSM